MRLFLLIISFFICISSFAKSYNVLSPNKNIEVEVEERNNKVLISTKSKDTKILAPSPINLNINDKNLKWEIISNKTTKEKIKIDMPYGEFSSKIFVYNELTLQSKEYGARLIVRAYDQTMAYKVEFDALPEQTKIQETSKFLPYDTNGAFKCPNGEREPLDPRSFTAEDKFKSTTTPVVYQASDYAFAIHECDLRDYSQLTIAASANDKGFVITSQDVNTTKQQFNTPWRVLLIGKDMAQIHNQKPVYQTLNPETKDDFSWVKPGFSTWDWRNRDMVFNGFKYDANTATFKRFIDFCSSSNIEYFLIDASWYDNNPLQAIDAIDIKEVIDYGKAKNVGIILYYDTHYTKASKKGNNTGKLVDFETVAKHFSELGAAGIKYGFHRGATSQTKVQTTIEIIKTCAKYKLLVDFHDGPIPFSGIERTYPNNVTREYCHAQLDTRTAFSADAFVKMSCVNLLIGNIDQTNGTYMLNSMETRSKGPRNEYISTVAGENARVLITHTGSLSVIIDAPEAYEQKADFFSFIKDMPRTWDESLYLEMDFLSHVSVARRKGNTWYAATAFDNEGGEHTMKLDFLKPGKKYIAKIFKDAPDADGTTNKEAYAIETQEVTSKSSLTTKVAKSGGYSVIFTEK